MNNPTLSMITSVWFALVVSAPAAALNWDTVSGDGAAITPGSGTWGTGSGNWNNAGTDVNWAASDTATFGGADGAYTITVTNAIATGSGTAIAFTNSGYTLGASSAQTITLGGTISIATNKTATIGTNVVVTRSGGFNPAGGGTLNISGTGAILRNASGNNILINGGTIINVLSGGTFQNTGSSASSIAAGGDSIGATIFVNGGAMTVQGNFILNNGTGKSVVTLTNGAAVSLTTVGNAVRFGGTGGSGTLNLDGGILTTPRIFENAAAVSSTNNFNGGTLKVLAGTTSAANFMTGLDRANVRNGGAIIDPNGQSITIGQALLHSDNASDQAMDGGLTVAGAGTVTLTGANTYTGPTTINAGKLAIIAPYGAITAPVVNNGARLRVTSAASSSVLPVITLNDGGGIEFDLGVFNPANVPAITNASLVVPNGTTNKIDIAGFNIPVTVVTLLAYTNKTGAGVFELGALPVGMAATLTDTGSNLVLNVTSPSAKFFVWSAGTNNWDFTSLNWNANSAAYSEPALVTFPGNAAGTVTITTNVNPFSVTVDVTNVNYTLGGVGSIGGVASLTKQGARILTLASSNSFSGPTTLGAGSIVVTTNFALGGTAGGTTVASGMTLALSSNVNYSAAEPLTLAGPGVAGNHFFTGSATQRGALQSLSDDNTWTGDIVFTTADTRIGVQDGARLTLTGSITEATNGLNLIFRHGNTAGSDITVSGTSNHWTGFTDIYGGAGVVRIGTNNVFPKGSLLRVGVTGIGGNCTFDLNGFDQEVAGLSQAGDAVGVVLNGGANNSTLTLNPLADQTYAGVITDNGSYTVSLVKNGTNTQTLTGANTYLGPTTINGGTLHLAASGSLGSTAVAVNGGKLSGFGTIAGPVTVGAGGTLAPGSGAIGALTINNDLTLAGNLVFKLDKSLAPSNDVVNVIGVLTNIGAGTLMVTNIGTNALEVGDTFTLFSQAVGKGLALTLSGPAGVTFTNNLEVDGSIAVLTVPVTTADYATNITFAVTGSTLSVSWPATHLGWFLQAQTNTLGVGLSTNWVDLPGSNAGTNATLTIQPADPAVFLRLRHP